jgi:hypothetical protein
MRVSSSVPDQARHGIQHFREKCGRCHQHLWEQQDGSQLPLGNEVRPCEKHSLGNVSLVYLRFDSILASRPVRTVGFARRE